MTTFNNTKLSIVTWNVWFDELEQTVRYDAILSICRELNPDIICFQEVIPYFVEKLGRDDYFSANYDISDSKLDGKTIEPYGVMILSKKILKAAFSFHILPTIYRRKLLVAEFRAENGEMFAVGTVHMESLSNHPTREAQMAICYEVLTKYKHSILCGDFNFCSYRNYRNAEGPLENASLSRIMPDFQDVWSELHTTSVSLDVDGVDSETTGYTFDTLRNPMIGHADERMRYDRICCRFDSSTANTTTSGLCCCFKSSGDEDVSGVNRVWVWRPMSIEIIGDSPVMVGSDSSEKPTVAISAIIASSSANNNANATPSTYDSPTKAAPPNSSGSGMHSTYRPMKVLARGCKTPVDLYPSDHFGLYATFEFCSSESTSNASTTDQA